MKNLITKEMVEAATVNLPETYSVGVSFSKEYGGSVTGVNIVVLKVLDGIQTLVYSEHHKVDET